MILRGSNPDVYVTGRDDFRASQRLQTSENHEHVLDVGSAPATNMRQNQYQVDDRTHTTNTPRQDTHGQHWMSARAMSAHFFTSLHPCFTQSGTYDGVGKQGLVRHSQPLLRPVHESHHSQYIDRKTRRSPCRWSHTGRCDGQPQTVHTRFDTRVSLRQVFHLHRNYGYFFWCSETPRVKPVPLGTRGGHHSARLFVVFVVNSLPVCLV